MKRCGWVAMAAWLALVLGAAAAEPAAAGVAAYENFSDSAWSSLGRGAEWKVVSSNEVHETDPDEPWKNNGFYRMLEERGAMTYELDVQVATNKGGAGLFIMGRDPKAVEHGDSYLVYVSAGTEVAGKKGAVCIGKFVKDKPDAKWSPKFALPVRPGEWVSLTIHLAAAKGEFVVFAGGKEIGRAQDKSAILTGNHVCLHSFGTAAKFRRARFGRK